MEQQDKKKKQNLLSKPKLTMRLLAGGYLVYLAYQLFAGLEGSSTRDLIIFVIAAIGFTIAGAILIYFAGMAMYRGEYIGGFADVEEEEHIKDL